MYTMTALAQRKTKLTFETADSIRQGRSSRPIVIEAEPEYAVLRLKGTRGRLTVTWAGIYVFAAKCKADSIRREKAASKKGGRD
jgi:hypothetical protein